MRGIIPRTVEQILSRVKVLKEGRWNYTISASFLEIYNEQVCVSYQRSTIYKHSHCYFWLLLVVQLVRHVTSTLSQCAESLICWLQYSKCNYVASYSLLDSSVTRL
jgi:Kinesin motor domain